MQKEDIVKLKKKFTPIKTNAIKKIKPNLCIICKKEINSTCVSHSIPKFILKNISRTGNLYTWNKLVGIDIIENNKGLKEAGVFRKICRECDNTIFKEYETPDNYQKSITNTMLHQISIKILLNNIYTREMSVNLVKESINQLINDKISKMLYERVANQMCLEPEKITIKEEYKKLNIILNSSIKNIRYKMIFNYKLPYVVPYAFQDEITLVSDMLGNSINNVFSKDEKYRMQSIKLCIFPLKNETCIIMYREKQDKRYIRFEHQFNKLTIDDKIAVINYMVFLYSEKYLISDYVDKKIFDSNIAKYSEMTQHNIYCIGDDPYTKEFRMKHRLDNFTNCENLLSAKYALSKIE